MAGRDVLGRNGLVVDVQIQAVRLQDVQQIVAEFADQVLRRLIRELFADADHVRQIKGDEDRVLQPPQTADDADDVFDVLRLKVVLDLQHARLAVLPADADVLLQRREHQIRARVSVQIVHADGAQRVKVRLLDAQVHARHAPGVVVVHDDVFSVRRAVDIGLNAVVAPVARRDKRRAGILPLDAAQTAVRDHARPGGMQPDGFPHGLSLFPCPPQSAAVCLPSLYHVLRRKQGGFSEKDGF